MDCVKISKSSSLIQYEDSKRIWDADIIFNISNREILVLGTTRVLSSKERNNIITKILNVYAFR
jgi:hypothetical protein